MASNDVIVRLRMLGAAAFTATARGAASSVRGIGDAAESTSRKTGGMSGALDRAGRSLQPIWGLAARGGAALGVAGAAAVGMGLKFDAGMEQSKVAFTNLLGSADDAQAMLDRLYKIAAHTPFEFPQLTQSTQRLLGFGMAAKDVVPTMTAVGDAVAAAGGGAEQIDRVSTALGQMQAKGKVSSEELLQLAESGVPALKILQDQLGLTGQELSTKLQAGAITADQGISALVSGMEKRYGGMAEAQSKTFSGMLSTLKDTANQILGTVAQPLFEFLRDSLLPQINTVANAIGKWAKAGGMKTAMNALKAGFTEGVGPQTQGFEGFYQVLVKVGNAVKVAFGAAKTYWVQLMAALEPAMPFIRNVMLPLLKGIAIGVLGSVVMSFKVLIPIIRIVATVLGYVGEKAAPLRGVIEKLGMVIGFVAAGPILRIIGGLGKLGGVFKVVAGIAKVAAIPLRIYGGILRGLIGLVGRLFGVLSRMAPIAARAASALLRPFKALVDDFLQFGKNIVTAIANGIRSAPGTILNAIKSLLPGGKFGRKVAGALGIGLQHGGILRAGTAFVGEAGPELLQVKSGAARVYPLPAPSVASIGGAMAGAGGGTIVVPVHLDGRVITEVVARRTADRRARR